jgi:hypothetical protein
MALAKHRDDVVAAEFGGNLQLGAGRFDHLNLGFRSILGDDEMLRPDSIDHGMTVASRRRREQRQADAAGTLELQRPLARIVPLRKFIAGEPMKPATNRFCGRS